MPIRRAWIVARAARVEPKIGQRLLPSGGLVMTAPFREKSCDRRLPGTAAGWLLLEDFLFLPVLPDRIDADADYCQHCQSYEYCDHDPPHGWSPSMGSTGSQPAEADMAETATRHRRHDGRLGVPGEDLPATALPAGLTRLLLASSQPVEKALARLSALAQGIRELRDQ